MSGGRGIGERSVNLFVKNGSVNRQHALFAGTVGENSI